MGKVTVVIRAWEMIFFPRSLNNRRWIQILCFHLSSSFTIWCCCTLYTIQWLSLMACFHAYTLNIKVDQFFVVFLLE